MKIRFKKDTKDVREGRDKIIPRGKVLIVDDWLGKQYLKSGAAELVKGGGQKEVILSSADVEKGIEKLKEDK